MNLSKKKTLLACTALILLAGVICLVLYLKSVSEYKQEVKNISLGEITISDMDDGTYFGECDVNFIYTNVKVTIQDGRISDIAILQHKNDRGKAAERIITQIIAEQKINVDSISGATNSSVVLKKAVENALTQR